MDDKSLPREYNDWRTDLWGRKEDAAYTFGYHLIKHCRNEAIESLPNDMTNENREKAIEAINTALHNVMDMIEGFWKLESGENHSIEYIIQVLIKDKSNTEIEKIDIASGLDLPIGFWKWTNDGEFR